MRKVLVIGLLLTAVIYLLPVFCGFLEDDAPLPIPQESVAGGCRNWGECPNRRSRNRRPQGRSLPAQEITGAGRWGRCARWTWRNMW